MPNNKAVGVAFSDPALDGAVIENSVIGGSTPAAGTFSSLNVTGGAEIGNAAGDLIGFHGATPVDQAATIASVSLPAWSAGGYGPTGTATLTSMLAAINAITAALKEKGILASS